MPKLLALLIASACIASLGFAPAAQGTALVSVGWETPGTMTAGGTATQDLVITNYSDAGEPTTLSPIWFVPSCGTTDISPCEAPDIGVFSVDSPVIGPAGQCNEDLFPVVAADTVPATGRVGLNPSPALTLAAGAPAPGESCRIRLAYHVLRVPTYDSDPAMAGVQTRQAFQYTLNGSGVTSHANQVTVNPDPTPPLIPATGTAPGTNLRATALKKCKKKKGKARKKCVAKAKKLPL